MSSTRSRGRVAVALTAALLAGAGTVWATRAGAATTAPLAGKPTSSVQVTAPLTAPGDPGRPLLRSGWPGAPPTDGPNPGPSTAARKVLTPARPTSVSIARSGPPRLHLITCGGEFDRAKRHYAQNVVVLALPAP